MKHTDQNGILFESENIDELVQSINNIQINDNHVASEEIIRKFSVSTVSNQYYELLKNII